MKLTDLKTQDTIALVKSVEQKQKEDALIGSTRQKAGHTLFEVNLKTGTIEKAKFEKQDVKVTRGFEINIKNKVIVKEDCIYVSALNVKNVIKKVFKKLNK